MVYVPCTLMVKVPRSDVSKPLEKQSTTAPLRSSVASVWAVEVNIVELEVPLIMVIVNIPHISSGGMDSP